MSTPRNSTCPICSQPTKHDYRPFCSKRCADVDLHRWLNGSYAIPGEEDESASEPDLTRLDEHQIH